jgi:hypothetical protein
VRGIWEIQRGEYFSCRLPHNSGKRACGLRGVAFTSVSFSARKSVGPHPLGREMGLGCYTPARSVYLRPTPRCTTPTTTH